MEVGGGGNNTSLISDTNPVYYSADPAKMNRPANRGKTVTFTHSYIKYIDFYTVLFIRVLIRTDFNPDPDLDTDPHFGFRIRIKPCLYALLSVFWLYIFLSFSSFLDPLDPQPGDH
jgi:hypothetical protein